MRTLQIHSSSAQIECGELGREVQLFGEVSREYSGGQLENEITDWQKCSGQSECRQSPGNCPCSSSALDTSIQDPPK